MLYSLYVTPHGKTGKKVNAWARVPLVSQICAYVISKTMSVTVDIVLHAKAFVQSSELFDTLNVPKDTRVKSCMQYMFKARDFPSVKRNWQRKLSTQIALLS